MKFAESVVQKEPSQHQLLNVEADEAAGTVINAHAALQVCYLLRTPAARSSSPVSSVCHVSSFTQ